MLYFQLLTARSDIYPHPEGGRGPGTACGRGFWGRILDRAKAGPERGRLIGQVPVQGFIARVSEVEGREPVVVMPADWVGDVCGSAPESSTGMNRDPLGSSW